jgi:hypothetical protein
MIKLIDMFNELSTWITFSPAEMEAASNSKITNKNNPKFKALISNWGSGVYDEDPGYIVDELKGFL